MTPMWEAGVWIKGSDLDLKLKARGMSISAEEVGL